MNDAVRSLKPWAGFAGSVLVVVVLYWAQAILVPIALALLLTFLLTPLATALQRLIGRITTVISVVVCTFAFLGLIGWGFARQMTSLAQDLPRYRDNIRQKISDIQGLGKGGSVERVQTTLHEIKEEIAQGEAPRSAGQPVVVSEPVESLWKLPAWMEPFVGPVGTAGLVIVLEAVAQLDRRC